MQTHGWGESSLDKWTLPWLIEELDPEEVRIFWFTGVCSRGHWNEWKGYVRNQLLHQLNSPTGDIVHYTEPSDGLKNALKQTREMQIEIRDWRAKAEALAVALHLGENITLDALERLVPDLQEAVRACIDDDGPDSLEVPPGRLYHGFRRFFYEMLTGKAEWESSPPGTMA
jgi:hypothetical protein